MFLEDFVFIVCVCVCVLLVVVGGGFCFCGCSYSLTVKAHGAKLYASAWGKKTEKKEDKINEFSRVNKLVSDILEVDNGVVVELQL